MSEILKSLQARLPELAGQVVVEYQGDDAARHEFLDDLDGVGQHEPRWHQFGIVTHNQRAAASYSDELPGYLGRWGLTDSVATHLEQEIDGAPRAELLGVGLLFHDIGKFAARAAVEKDGLPAFTFDAHERFSGEILRCSCLNSGQYTRYTMHKM